MTYEPDLPDSVHALYDLTCAEDGIDAEQIDAILDNTVEQQVRELYNNREEIAAQLSEAGTGIEDAKRDGK